MNKLFFTILFLGIVHASFSQVLMGPKLGAQISKTVFHNSTYNIDYQNRYKPGFNLGVVLNYKVTERFSFHSELCFSNEGKRLYKRGHPDYENVVNYFYIDLPLLLRVSIPQDRYNIYFNAGPNISYWLGGMGRLKTTTTVEFPEDDYLRYFIKFDRDTIINDNKTMHIPNARRLQFGIDLGGGVVVPLANNRDQLMIDFRYTIGHSYLGTKKGSNVNYVADFDENLEAAPRVISFSIAYLRGFDVKAVLKKGKSIRGKQK